MSLVQIFKEAEGLKFQNYPTTAAADFVAVGLEGCFLAAAASCLVDVVASWLAWTADVASAVALAEKTIINSHKKINIFFICYIIYCGLLVSNF